MYFFGIGFISYFIKLSSGQGILYHTSRFTISYMISYHITPHHIRSFINYFITINVQCYLQRLHVQSFLKILLFLQAVYLFLELFASLLFPSAISSLKTSIFETAVQKADTSSTDII